MPEKVPAAAVTAEDPFLVVVSVETGRPEQHDNIKRDKDEEEEVIQLLLGQDDVGVGGEVGEGEQTVKDEEREGHHSRPSGHHQGSNLPHLVVVHTVSFLLLFRRWILGQKAEAEN